MNVFVVLLLSSCYFYIFHELWRRVDLLYIGLLIRDDDLKTQAFPCVPNHILYLRLLCKNFLTYKQIITSNNRIRITKNFDFQDIVLFLEDCLHNYSNISSNVAWLAKALSRIFHILIYPFSLNMFRYKVFSVDKNWKTTYKF